MTSENKIKIKRHARKATQPAKYHKPILVTIKPKQIRAKQTVKPTPQVGDKTTLLTQVKDQEVLIMRLTLLVNKNWKEEEKTSVFLTPINQIDTILDPLHILVTYLHKTNSIDLDDFVFST